MDSLRREINYCGGAWPWLTSPVFGYVRNPTDCGVYCGWFVVWFDWGEYPVMGDRFTFGWDIR